MFLTVILIFGYSSSAPAWYALMLRLYLQSKTENVYWLCKRTLRAGGGQFYLRRASMAASFHQISSLKTETVWLNKYQQSDQPSAGKTRHACFRQTRLDMHGSVTWRREILLLFGHPPQIFYIVTLFTFIASYAAVSSSCRCCEVATVTASTAYFDCTPKLDWPLEIGIVCSKELVVKYQDGWIKKKIR